MSPRRTRAAANAGPRPAVSAEPSWVEKLTRLGGPGELRLREAVLAFVLDAEGVDPRALRLCDDELRPKRVVHADEPHRLAGLHAEGHDVLDLEVDRIADLDAVPQSVLLHLDCRPLDTEH